MTVRLDSSVVLRPLIVNKQGATWIVGRQDTGEFVEVPIEALTFVRALQDGDDVGDAAERVERAHGQAIDAAAFVETIIETGFVASVDGVECESSHLSQSLTWLKPRHVKWAFTKRAFVFRVAFIAAGVVTAWLAGIGLPDHRAYFVSDSQSVNVAWNTGLFLAALALHELSHLAAARSEDVYSRIGLGTRLQFLVAQTTVSGLWGASRSLRLRVFMAGMASDMMLMSLSWMVLATLEPTGLLYRFLESLTLVLLFSLGCQCALYMRTDLYFVLQEVLHCKNLYADAWRYLRYLLSRYAWRRHESPPFDPTLAVPQHERKSIKAYAFLMFTGSVVTVGLYVAFGGPITGELFVQSVAQVRFGLASGQPSSVADGITVLTIEGVLHLVFLRLYFLKHRPKVAAMLASVKRRRELGLHC